jgi:chloride channel protein, CIC family
MTDSEKSPTVRHWSWPQSLSLRPDQLQYIQLILLATAVGVLGALGNLGFRALIDFFSWLFRTLEWQALGIARDSLLWLLIPVILVSGGVGMLILNYFFPGEVLGYGFPNFLETVNLGNARIKPTWIFLKGLGAALSLGSGASVGREGPIAQIGGAIGSTIAQIRRLTPERAKVMVAAGAGAGIATTFNAPIGGLMFAQEIVLLGHTELANLTLLIIASTTAVVTSRLIMGSAAVFHPVPFVLSTYREMLTYTLMGICFGVLGAAYIRFYHATANTFRRLKLPEWLKLALGLTLVGMIAIVLPENLSDGYPVIDMALAGQFALGMMAALTLAKFTASSISLSCGAPGGVFGPIFFIGTMAGGTFQQVSAKLLPHFTGPRGSYALVGLGTFLAGVAHAPLTALFLLFEMTQDYQIALPAMVATIAALVVSRAIEPESIDTLGLARAGKSLEIGKDRLVLTQIQVGAVMTKKVTTVHQNSSLTEILRAAGETPQRTLPVTDGDGVLKGIIVTRDLLALLGSRAELGPLVNAYDLCRESCPTVTPESNLDETTQVMEHEGLDELPVVDQPHDGHLLGMVARRDVAQAFNRVSVSLTMAGRDSGISWATGYRVGRISIPKAADGKTLRMLDPRARFGVSVLAVQDVNNPEGGFAPIAPDRRLKPGDLIVAAGRPADIRKFTRSLEQA